jgi:multimeric flavodoxin WrbA
MLLEKALEGAKSLNAQTKLIHLYDLNFKGCVSCFFCKTKKNYLSGRCGHKDDLTEVLELVENSTGLILGSPIYVGDVTGVMRCFLERYAFINLAYDPKAFAVRTQGQAVGLIYTMNVQEEDLDAMGYGPIFRSHKSLLERLQSPIVEQLFACDTLQFDDYSRFHAPMFDEAHKKRVRSEQFPIDLKKAYDLGRLLASQSHSQAHSQGHS